MISTPQTVLELLSQPGAWTKGTQARDINRKLVFPNDPTAVCWCLSGAIQKIYKADTDIPWYADADSQVIKVFAKVMPLILKYKFSIDHLNRSNTPINNITTFNDADITTLEDVLAVAKEANI